MKFLLALSLKIKIIIISCVAAAAVTVTAVVVVINSEDAYRVIKVFEIEGEAVVARENTGELEAYEGMNLESGDVLHVGDGSYMRLSLDNDKYILLDSGTVLELIAEGSSNDSRTVVNLKEGTILNEITNALSANSSYEVNTPKATMAVRGTSFKVTVTKTDEGGYVTDIDTVHGKVLVQLYDENGNLKAAEAIVTEGNRATILTDPNSETGNAPELDGNAYFVFRKSGDTFIPCGDDDPIYASDYSTFSEIVKSVALNSNDSELLLLDKEIADKLRGIGTDSAESETSESETSEAETSAAYAKISETEAPDTSSESYAATAAALPVSDIPEVTTVPTETAEQTTVIPSEQTSASETEPPITETSQTITASMTDTEKTSEEITTTPAATQTTMISTETTPHQTTFHTYMSTYAMPYIPAVTTSPVSEYTETVTESETTAETTSVTEDTETVTESETTTEALPAVYNVSFVDGDGNTVLTSTVEDGGKIEALPEITERRGYTAKWVSGGAEVTTDTVIGADMEITAEYTPKPVTVQISAPHSGDPQNTYDTVLEFTIPYDGTITDSTEGYNIENLTEYVMNLYADYLNEHGGTIELEYIHSIGRSEDNIYSEDVVTDDYIITGDHVFDESEGLYASVGFQLSYTQ